MNPGGEPERLVGLPPILDAGIRTLILGSFPSPASLSAGQYYAHRQNQFWRLLGALLNEPLPEFDYLRKQRTLLGYQIGVWDVYRCCRRQGALDSAITAAEVNDFASLSDNAPQLVQICFNGQTAGRFAAWFARRGYKTSVLPSTSPAYTRDFRAKLDQWRSAGLGR